MTETNTITSTNDNEKAVVDTMFDSMSDEEVLTELSNLITNGRFQVSTEFLDAPVQDGATIYIGEFIKLQVGDKMIVSNPVPFDWPLEPIDKPADMEGSIN